MASQTQRHEFEQAPGDGEGQGSVECCSPWGHKESDKTELLNIHINSFLTESYAQAFNRINIH